MHWVEAAEDNDAARGTAKADFMDSLNAQWLYNRIGIQRKEVAAAFFRFLQVPNNPPQMIAPLSDVIADLAGRPAERNSRDFVAHLRTIGANHPLEQSLTKILNRTGSMENDFALADSPRLSFKESSASTSSGYCRPKHPLA